jgi:hypothetical protein
MHHNLVRTRNDENSYFNFLVNVIHASVNKMTMWRAEHLIAVEEAIIQKWHLYRGQKSHQLQCGFLTSGYFTSDIISFIDCGMLLCLIWSYNALQCLGRREFCSEYIPLCNDNGIQLRIRISKCMKLHRKPHQWIVKAYNNICINSVYFLILSNVIISIWRKPITVYHA